MQKEWTNEDFILSFLKIFLWFVSVPPVLLLISLPFSFLDNVSAFLVL
jgi:hypothetical protein